MYNYIQYCFNSLLPGKFFPLFFVVCWIFSKSTVSKKSFRNTIRDSNSLDPDKARRSVWTDLVPNCLQRLSADDMNENLLLQYVHLKRELSRSSEIYKIACTITYNVAPGKFFPLFCRLLNFFKINFFEKFFQEYDQGVKQFGSRSGLTERQAWSGSKLFAKVISRQH